MNKKISIFAVIAVVVIATTAGVYFSGIMKEKNEKSVTSLSTISGTKIIMYKSPNCGCCTNYADKLKEVGVNIDIVSVEDMSSMKDERNIPQDMRSCHTLEADGYVVEGHVPIEAIEKLLTERPAVDGIAMPGMPAGALGMGGIKKNPFEVYQITDGEYAKFVTI